MHADQKASGADPGQVTHSLITSALAVRELC